MVNLSASPCTARRKTSAKISSSPRPPARSAAPSPTSTPSVATTNSSSTAAATSSTRRATLPRGSPRSPRSCAWSRSAVPFPTRPRPPRPSLRPPRPSHRASRRTNSPISTHALVLGVRDYATKTGFKRALVALSGGIDSALVAVIAADALGAENVTGVSLPSAISSQHSRDDARLLAENLGIRFETIRIADVVNEAEKVLWHLFSQTARDVTEENIQARVRGVLMMALSNKFGSLLLTTGNKSEMAVGYCTLYGDMCGGLAVISDVFKTQVYASPAGSIARRKSSRATRSTRPRAPNSAPTRPIKTASRPTISSTRSSKVTSRKASPAATSSPTAFPKRSSTMSSAKSISTSINENKPPPGLKITPLAFGVGRRIPIVQKYVS